MCWPGRANSRGAKAKRAIVFDKVANAKFKLNPRFFTGTSGARLTRYKLLKFLKFLRSQARPATFLLQNLQPLNRDRVRELGQCSAQFLRSQGRVGDHFFPVKQLLQGLPSRFVGPALDNLSGDLQRVFRQVVQEIAKQLNSGLLAGIQASALLWRYLLRDGRKSHEPHYSLPNEAATACAGARLPLPVRSGLRMGPC